MTIKDLARLSGYSLGTVSRVLNNQPNVSGAVFFRYGSLTAVSGFMDDLTAWYQAHPDKAANDTPSSPDTPENAFPQAEKALTFSQAFSMFLGALLH